MLRHDFRDPFIGKDPVVKIPCLPFRQERREKVVELVP